MPTLTLSPLQEATLVAFVAAEETDAHPLISRWVDHLLERTDGWRNGSREMPYLCRLKLLRYVGRLGVESDGSKKYRVTERGIAHVRELGAKKCELAIVHGCEDGKCGGWFWCPGCQRVVGWCMGAHDEHPDHCDDCANKLAGAAE
jgi:hypothetical protein